MTRSLLLLTGFAGLFCTSAALADDKKNDKDNAPAVHPTAIFPFEERGAGVRELGAKVSDILFARLAAAPELVLVERDGLKKMLEEQELGASGLVKSNEAAKIGQLTGAKVLITGSILQVDKKIYVVAKIIGTETGRVLGESVSGKAGDELAPLVEQLADKVAEKIKKQAEDLVSKPVKDTDRIAVLNKQFGKAKRPVLWIKIAERHIGQTTFDPAAQTEFLHIAKGAGFEVIDSDDGAKAKADFIITGEGLSEFAVRTGNLVSVRARLEIKVVEPKTDKVVAADRRTVLTVDLSEQIAGKSALQKAAAESAESVLAKLVKPAE